MSYRLIQQMQQKAIPAMHACRVLQVSRAGFYAAQRRWKRPATTCRSSVYLQAAFAASSATYGSRRLRASLAQQDIQAGRYRVRTLMQRHG